MRRVVLLVCVVLFSLDALPQYLRYSSVDSVGGKPLYEGSIFVKLKLNGVFDITGGLQGQDVFKIEQINVWDNDNTPNIWMDMYQSQIRFSGTRQINGHEATGYVEGDFWGGSGHFRLRHAYVKYWFFQFGQDWSFFGDKDIWPNVFDWDGPPTGVWSRAPHLQFFINNDNAWRYELGIARQTDFDIDFESIDDPLIEPTSGNPFPDFIGAINKRMSWGHLRFTAIGRRFSYKVKGKGTSYANGYGATLSGLVKTHPLVNNTFQFQFVAGTGIASYLASYGGHNYNALQNGLGELRTIPVVGAWGAYEHYLTAKWHVNVVGGFNMLKTHTIAENPFDYDKVPLTDGVQKFRGLYMLGNVMYDPFENFTIGIEYNYGHKRNFYDGTINGIANSSHTQSRDANRISFGLFYNF